MGASISEMLMERGKRYGGFMDHARITQGIKDVLHAQPNWGALTVDKKEALEMIAHKMGRILNGDPAFKDSWVDIAGYAQLVADTLHDPT